MVGFLSKYRYGTPMSNLFQGIPCGLVVAHVWHNAFPKSTDRLQGLNELPTAWEHIKVLLKTI